MSVTPKNNHPMHELIFFVFFGLMSVGGIVHYIYFWNLVNSARASMNHILAYPHIIKPVTIICVVLLIAGILTKFRILALDRLSPKARKVLLVTGIIFTSIMTFYILVFSLYIMMRVQHIVIHDLFYILIHPFRSNMIFYGESLAIRNLIYVLGALALFFAKTNLGKVRKEGTEEFRDYLTKKHANIKYIVFWGILGSIIIAGMVHYIYLRIMVERIGFIDHSIRPNTIAHLFIIRPVMVMSIVLLISSCLEKLRILTVERLSPKAKKILLGVGIVFMTIIVLHMYVHGVFITGMQEDSWVKSLVSKELFFILEAPFSIHYYTESLIIRDIVAVIGVFTIFLAKSNDQKRNCIQ